MKCVKMLGLAVLLIGPLGFVLGGVAHAAEREGVISNLAFEEPKQAAREQISRVTADWQVEAPVPGDTFGLDLPSEFTQYVTDFQLLDEQTVVADCAVAGYWPTSLTCTLSDAVADATSVGGDLFFDIKAKEPTANTSVDFVVDGAVVPVDLPGGGGIADYSRAAASDVFGRVTPAGNIEWMAIFRNGDSSNPDPVARLCLDDVPSAPATEPDTAVAYMTFHIDWPEDGWVGEGSIEPWIGNCFETEPGYLDSGGADVGLLFEQIPQVQPEAGDVFRVQVTSDGAYPDMVGEVRYGPLGGGTAVVNTPEPVKPPPPVTPDTTPPVLKPSQPGLPRTGV